MRTFEAGAQSVTESDEMICVVWSWTTTYPDRTVDHKLTWIKGDAEMYYEVKNPGGQWIAMRVRNEKYRPRGLIHARELATEFIGGDDG